MLARLVGSLVCTEGALLGMSVLVVADDLCASNLNWLLVIGSTGGMEWPVGTAAEVLVRAPGVVVRTDLGVVRAPGVVVRTDLGVVSALIGVAHMRQAQLVLETSSSEEMSFARSMSR